MFKNYLKIAWRNLVQNKSFSILNIVGLALGLAVTTLIMLWINHELHFDKFHQNIDRIYEANNQLAVNGEIQTWNTTPQPMAAAIKKDYPEVERVARLNWDNTVLFSKDEKRIKGIGHAVDTDFLKIFDFPLVKGDQENIFSDAYSMIITEDFSKKLFGAENPVGKTIKVDNSETFTITGVLKNLPTNTRFQFEYLIPWSYLKQRGWVSDYWGNNNTTTFVMLKQGIDYAAFAAKIKDLRKNYDKEGADMITYLQPFSRTYLYSKFKNGLESGGRIDTIRLFGIIAIIVLVMACINFMNLSTARSQKRAKEVGVRKVIGARKKTLITQFLGESILISFIAALVALIIVFIVLPSFNSLVGKELSLDFSNKWFWFIAVGVILFTGILAGSYPAWYLSAFQPSAVLKGTFQKINAFITPRKVLVVTQFTVAIVLITATIIVREQIENAQDRSLGYNQNNLVFSWAEGDLSKNYSLLKNELLASGAATSVTRMTSPITSRNSDTWGLIWKGKDENDKTTITRMGTDQNIVKTMGFELVAGRDIDLQKFPTDSSAMILNETAVKHMGFEEPLGQIVIDDGKKWTVVGVIKDYIYESPYQKVVPMVIEAATPWARVIHIKFNNDNPIKENLAKTEAIFKKFNPEYPFEYYFADEQYARKFRSTQRVGSLASLFTILTIFISCLGLFGLASYMAENRKKEIGVRKVLGASVQSIAALLSKDFFKLILISFLVAVPISWYTMQNWLEDFSYRIDISWGVFVLVAFLVTVISILTVSYQSIKAAITNPVKSLRTE
ncbi:ABC transporter permease [Spongiivirga citrea]|uniref:FtsX-like permease family protein n=1 Tax=Spongiivirga citrea TaxID=1481457 RepID=A0A6M0CIJ3_9FLAO|nr:ABC transporter permease [Spongiivirga citrea]NER17342.1 FtsX-like permease family protein [Spongiivirga citrea]